MAETLLAILLVTTSVKESTLVFKWPENPTPSPRLGRPRPDESLSISALDNPWRASHPEEGIEQPNSTLHDFSRDPTYAWPRPLALRGRALSFGDSSSHRSSHSRGEHFGQEEKNFSREEHVLGFSAEFLAELLCPRMAMCHQKFELVVDDLAFIGHPVCVDDEGKWMFKPEKIKAGSRGREARDLHGSYLPESSQPSTREASQPELLSEHSNWLHTFHLVLVLDVPDPSSYASGNVLKYFNILYEQIAFTLTAVLYQEQVLSNFVERECDALISLKESCIAKGEPFSTFASQALEVSSIASAIKTLFEAIKSSAVAYITINYLPLELQLPPYLDTILHSQGDQGPDNVDPFDDNISLNWGQDMALGWKLPTVVPWKTLLLLDVDNDMDPHQILKGPYDTPEYKSLAEGLIRFLETASITLSLYEMANLLDWDLESQVYPIVMWLVLHRRAKVVDVVHPGLRTVFALPPKFNAPLSQLAKEFQNTFSHPSIPPLPRILSMLSTSLSKPTDNHFFASVVKSKEFIPMYHDVVLWMLKRDMLVTLHLRIRIVATRTLKLRVKAAQSLKIARKQGPRRRRRSSEYNSETPVLTASKSTSFLESNQNVSPHLRRFSSRESGQSEISELHFPDAMDLENHAGLSETSETDNDNNSGWDTNEDPLSPSIIYDPGKATQMQRRWLAAMSDGIPPDIAKRFKLINQFFNGKRSDAEILHRAGITRKQLREVLHHYEDYLQTFLHPS